jgi:hypothetical protein
MNVQHHNTLIELKQILPTDLVYILAPYTAKLPDGSEDKVKVAERVRVVSLCMAKLMHMGIKTCSPVLMHLLRTYVNELPGDWAYWGEYSEVMLGKCDRAIVLMIDGWEKSTGIAAETELWNDRPSTLPMIYLDPVEFLKNE